MVTLDLAMDLVKGMVLGENRSYMTDTHFAELEGVREESTLLLRNFYKVNTYITTLHCEHFWFQKRPFNQCKNSKVLFILSQIFAICDDFS